MTFIESAKRLGVADFPENGLSEEQSKLRLVVKSFLECNEEKAEELARELLASARDEEIEKMAYELLFSILLWQDRFDELTSLGFPRNDDDMEQIAMYDTRDAEFLLSHEISEAEMPEFPMIQPIMTVQINGKNVNLLVDTGAMFTVITQSVAELTDSKPEEKSVNADAVTEGSVVTRAAHIKELKLGKSVIRNKRCLIMPDEALDFSAAGGPKINGMIGWEIIKRLQWEIDYKNRRIRLCAPRKSDVDRNMCCDFYPMVRMIVNGEPITAALDTGGNKTNFGKSMVGRFPGAEKDKRQMAGAGQSEASEYEGYVIPELPIFFDDKQIVAKNAFIHTSREFSPARTLLLSGSIGSDLFFDHVLKIDFENRHMSIARAK
ncbi:MAG: retroviral-like aspartic protease family protein [Oscillospiraceae bacterium]|nr:retroviral-like aspartic protease family protein [Oscillospiraceae bacterium]